MVNFSLSSTCFACRVLSTVSENRPPKNSAMSCKLVFTFDYFHCWFSRISHRIANDRGDDGPRSSSKVQPLISLSSHDRHPPPPPSGSPVAEDWFLRDFGYLLDTHSRTDSPQMIFCIRAQLILFPLSERFFSSFLFRNVYPLASCRVSTMY